MTLDASAIEQPLGELTVALGQSPLLGRLHAALVVSEEPASLDDLCAQVGAAKSTVSVAVRRLEAAGLVERVPMTGDRRDYWQARSGLADAVRGWFEAHLSPVLVSLRAARPDIPERRTPQVDEAIAVLEALQRAVAPRAGDE